MSKERKEKLQAAALRYDPERDDVPVLAAFGEGLVAERIIETAETCGVPVTADRHLASVLSKLSVGDQIPPQLYEVVAKLLVFVGEMDRGYGEQLRRAGKDNFK
ncbi:MAG: flagellar biogenesis protein [Clostridiales bacterium]|nr:flagellar biogenesis protein [Clostridiales bacterium]